MRNQAEVVVVGAGIMGLAIAYNLARHHGVRDITILDRSLPRLREIDDILSAQEESALEEETEAESAVPEAE